MKRIGLRSLLVALMAVLLLMMTACDGFTLTFSPTGSTTITKSESGTEHTAVPEEPNDTAVTKGESTKDESTTERPKDTAPVTTDPKPEMTQPNTTNTKPLDTTTAEPNIPNSPTLDFEGREVMILAQNEIAKDVFTEDTFSDRYSEMVFQRNISIEEKLNVCLVFTCISGVEYSTCLKMLSDVDENIYDIAYAYPRYNATVAAQGNAMNLNDPSLALQLDAEYWSASFKETATVNDRLYMMVGHSNYSVLERTVMVFFNHDLTSQLDISPYLDYANGTWTVEQMAQYVNFAYSDLDGNQGVTEGDLLGLTYMQSRLVYASLGGMNVSLTQRGSDGVYSLKVDMPVLDAYQKLTDLIGKVGAYQVASTASSNAFLSIFTEGRALFMINDLATMKDLSAFNGLYGVLPFPKVSVDQVSYGYRATPAYSVQVLVKFSGDHDYTAACAVMEALNSKSVSIHQSVFLTYLQTKEAYEVANGIFGLLNWEGSVLIPNSSASFIPETRIWQQSLAQGKTPNVLAAESKNAINQCFKDLFAALKDQA